MVKHPSLSAETKEPGQPVFFAPEMNRWLSRISEPSATLFKSAQRQQKSTKLSLTSSLKCLTRVASKRCACSNHFSSTKKQPPHLEPANANAEPDPLPPCSAQQRRLEPLQTARMTTPREEAQGHSNQQNPCSTANSRQSRPLSNARSLALETHPEVIELCHRAWQHVTGIEATIDLGQLLPAGRICLASTFDSFAHFDGRE